MEININKDIREYTESVFFGLNLRQLVCSGLAIASATGVYFETRDIFSKDTMSYLMIAAALPFAAIGFIKYNGMPMEKLIIAWLKDNIIVPRRLCFKSNNIYLETLKEYRFQKEKEALNAEKYTDNTEAG